MGVLWLRLFHYHSQLGFFVFVLFCMCASVYVCLYVCACVCGGSKLTRGVFFNCSPLYLWIQSLPLNRAHSIPASLTNLLASRVPVSASQGGDYRWLPHLGCLYSVLGISYSVLIFWDRVPLGSLSWPATHYID